MFYALACFFAPMIRCSVHDKDDVFSPLSSVLRCETSCQFWQEHHHYILISITLRLRHPDRSFWRDCNNDVDFMSKHSVSDWLSFTTSVPRSTSKVCLGHPTFINVNDMFSFTVDLQNLASVKVSQNLTSFRIASERYTLQFSITELELSLHCLSDCLDRNLHTCA